MAHNFKNLKIWQKAMDLTDLVFQYSKGLPLDEKYNLTNQINWSSCSIPANIAEDSGKRTKIHFGEFLSTALTSSFKLETQLLICERRNYGDKSLLNKLLDAIAEVQKMLFTFREKILQEKQ